VTVRLNRPTKAHVDPRSSKKNQPWLTLFKRLPTGYGTRRVAVRNVLSILCLTLLIQIGSQAKAGPTDHHIRRTHPANIGYRSHLPLRPVYFLNGGSWAFYPVYPYTGFADNGDIIYQGVDISDSNYPFAEPTSDPDIVVSPFPPNVLVGVAGIPPGAKVRDPVSLAIFLRP
jgi:hypothetical protein